METLLSERASPLLNRFKEFYFELIRLKRLVVEPSERGPEGEAAAASGEPDVLASEIWQRLLSLLERQALGVGDRAGVFGLEIYREAQYVMAALADEVFLHLDWPGRSFWSSHLLESKLFNSHVSGDLFFQKLDQLLKERDPAYTDLAVVYFMALSMGFKGRYRDSSDTRQLDFYRHETFAFIYRDDPRFLEESGHLFPKAYTPPLEDRPKAKFKDTRLWLGILAAAMVLWIGHTHLQWLDLSEQLETDVQEVMRLMR
jgi:type VI secretion system protein ImpK